MTLKRQIYQITKKQSKRKASRKVHSLPPLPLPIWFKYIKYTREKSR